MEAGWISLLLCSKNGFLDLVVPTPAGSSARLHQTHDMTDICLLITGLLVDGAKGWVTPAPRDLRSMHKAIRLDCFVLARDYPFEFTSPALS